MNSENGMNDNTLKVFNPSKLAKDGIKGPIFTGEFLKYEEATRENKTTGDSFLSRNYHFRDVDDGSLIILTATAMFDRLMEREQVEAGDLVRVGYEGKVKIPKGSAHRFTLRKDPSDI